MYRACFALLCFCNVVALLALLCFYFVVLLMNGNNSLFSTSLFIFLVACTSLFFYFLIFIFMVSVAPPITANYNPEGR